jgi:hypothetical protein
MMTGDCNAMQEQSCVQDAQTQNTYKCLAPGKSYFIQVFTPLYNTSGQTVTGNINLNLSAVHHADTCAPVSNCLSSAAFNTQFNCTTDDSVSFVNFSTYGANIQYQWNFGYNGQTATAIAPKFRYPALSTPQTYTVTLSVANTGFGNSTCQNTTTQQITIPARPNINLGPDTTLCTVGSNLLLNAATWSGTTYLWQNGSTASSITANTSNTALYWVRATYNGCISRDTIRVNINPISPLKQTKYLCGNDSVLLNSTRNFGESYAWNTGVTSASLYAFTGGLYIDNINWKGCSIKDTFNVIKAPAPFAAPDTTLCFPFHNFALNATASGATSYSWQNGSTSAQFTVTAPGQYWVRVNYPTCTLRDTVQVQVTQAPLRDTVLATICTGQSFGLPWGGTVSAAGIYADTVQYDLGCDSLIRRVQLTVTPAIVSISSASICSGDVYSLPWGSQVTTPGTYRDTLRTLAGCDSLIRTINLGVKTSVTQSSVVSLCSGQSYTLPWGGTVNVSGIYKDTLHYQSGCDSLIRMVNLSILPGLTQSQTASICSGSSYTLPWGGSVSTSGTYRDTVRYVTTGCDSLVRSLILNVQLPAIQSNIVSICQGSSYTLPWGGLVTTPGIYKDTIHYFNSSCDSLIRQVQVQVKNFTVQSSAATICSGSSYSLPWGTSVTTAGTYRDTLHYAGTGCDSLLRIITVSVNQGTVLSTSATICSGSSYSLPWGGNANSTGVYRDTLRYAVTGCDSLIRVVNLTVQPPVLQSNAVTICQGSSYTLPWGGSVSAAGVYKDTLHYFASGCDSLVRQVQLVVKTFSVQNNAATICSGSSYTLPWGTSVSSAGTYRDTLHFGVSGCDSLIRIVTINVNQGQTQSQNVTICSGSSYTLPWGGTVAVSGLYKDTLHYVQTGCDSLIRIVDLNVQSSVQQSNIVAVCSGSSYLLPWGGTVTVSGIYRDTLRYTTGCDSLIRSINLTVLSKTTQSSSAVICSGSSYILPWGTSVTSAGTYRDTLHYAISGCDSLIRVVSLQVKPTALQIFNPVICQGNSYILPWGTAVTTSGTYRDTLHYTSGGCDSVRRVVTLIVTPALVSSASAAICSDQTYTLPWGQVVNQSGLYRDTLRTVIGCDSLIRSVQLTVNPVPVISIKKSNDIDCILGTATLTATGGVKYQWSPSQTLNTASGSMTIASPGQTTMYHVAVFSANDCVRTDSILVKVSSGDAQNGYLEICDCRF